jgi:MFS family permease
MFSSKDSFYTSQFWLLCTSNFLFTASFQMLLPELPAYLRNMGGQGQIGLIIALFTLTAGLSRPFSGKITDTVGRVPVMAFGSLVCFVCGLVYPLISTVTGLLVLRFFHGFSTGTKPTATAAYVADIVPENRRGEAAGMVGIFHALGFSIGPALGSWLTLSWGINKLFYASSIFALLSILILAKMKETLVEKQKLQWSSFKIEWADVFDKRVLVVFFVMMFVCFPSGVLITLAPDHSEYLGIKNKGLFFLVYTLASLAVRIFLGKLSDRHGRRLVMQYTCITLFMAMVIGSFYTNIYAFYTAAVLFGMAYGMSSPTLTAWAIDLAHPQARGRALATMYIALELGIGLGALVAGFLYNGQIANLHLIYKLAALAALASYFSIFIFDKKK